MDMFKIGSCDPCLLRRRSSFCKATPEEDESLKNLLYEFFESQTEKYLVSSNVPIIWERLSLGYRVVDFEADRIEEALNLLKRHYFSPYQACSASALYLDSLTIKDYYEFVLGVLSNRNSFCVLEEGSSRMIAVAIADVNFVDEETDVDANLVLDRDVFHALKFEKALLRKANIKKKYEVSEYFCIHAVCVEPDFYGNGIGTSLIQACLSRARKLHYPVCIGIFPGRACQTIARRLEFDYLTEMSWIKVQPKFTESSENRKSINFDHVALQHSLVTCMGILVPVKEEDLSSKENSIIVEEKPRTPSVPVKKQQKKL